MSGPSFARLDAAGLNLQAVFDLAGLPEAIRGCLDPERQYRQLILVGHGGRRLWAAVCAAAIDSPDPIDDYTRTTLRTWLATEHPVVRWHIVDPGDATVDLQTLGRLAGWHHDTPFRVGINASWGSWFAYRAVVLTDNRWPLTLSKALASPCQSCVTQLCVTACPADALRDEAFSLPACIAYRLCPDSSCAWTCRARTACPVRAEHRYDEAQMAHSYLRSLDLIRAHPQSLLRSSGSFMAQGIDRQQA